MGRTSTLLLLAFVLAIGSVGLAGCVSSTNDSSSGNGGSSGAQTVYIDMAVATRLNSAGDDVDAFLPANVTVPVNTTVVFTILNYDPDPNPAQPEDAVVRGTVGGTMTVDGQSVSSVANTTVSHTLTIPGEPTDKLNVPLPVAKSDSQPTTVSFKVVFSQTGDFQWFCETPCDNYSMLTPGFMQGYIHVVA